MEVAIIDFVHEHFLMICQQYVLQGVFCHEDATAEEEWADCLLVKSECIAVQTLSKHPLFLVLKKGEPPSEDDMGICDM